MIALALLFITAVYLALFVVAGVLAKRWWLRFLLWALLLAPLIYKTLGYASRPRTL